MKRHLVLLGAILAGTMFCSLNAQEFRNVKEVSNGHGNCALIEGNVVLNLRINNVKGAKAGGYNFCRFEELISGQPGPGRLS